MQQQQPGSVSTYYGWSLDEPAHILGYGPTAYVVLPLGMHRSADYYAGIGRLLFTMYYDGIGY